MKTQISKKHALIILENALKQESLTEQIEKILHIGDGTYGGGFGAVEFLFDIDLRSMNTDDYEKIFAIFFDKAHSERRDFKNMASEIYQELAQARQFIEYKKNPSSFMPEPKMLREDALKILKARVMDYALWERLNSIGLNPEHYGGNFPDILTVFFLLPKNHDLEEMMEIFYSKAEHFIDEQRFHFKIPEDKLLKVSGEIYDAWIEELSRQVSKAA